MKSAPKAPAPDYKGMWNVVDRWQQEDKMWFDKETAAQAQGADVGAIKAQLAASGVQSGSDQWNAAIKAVEDKRTNIDTEMARRQKDIQTSGAYQELQKQYQSMVSKGGTHVMVTSKHPFTGNETSTLTSVNNARMNTVMTGGGSITGTHNADGTAFVAPSFQEWGTKTYGSIKVSNPYEVKQTDAEAATERVKTAASGGAAGAGSMDSFLEEDLNKNPWL